MSSNVATATRSTEHKGLDGVRPQMAKASAPVNRSQSSMTDVVRDGLIRACGSLKAAAIDMDIDQGQLTRDLQSGKFNFDRLERLAPEHKAIVISCLHEEYRAVTSPYAHARAVIRQAMKLLGEMEQFIDHVEERRTA